MQVYMVMGGFEGEGDDGDSLLLFDCKSTAQAYREKLKLDYDYVTIRVMNVIMGSALAA